MNTFGTQTFQITPKWYKNPLTTSEESFLIPEDLKSLAVDIKLNLALEKLRKLDAITCSWHYTATSNWVLGIDLWIYFKLFRFNLKLVRFENWPSKKKERHLGQATKKTMTLHSNFNLRFSERSLDQVRFFSLNLMWFGEFGFRRYSSDQKLDVVK